MNVMELASRRSPLRTPCVAAVVATSPLRANKCQILICGNVHAEGSGDFIQLW